MRVWFHFFGFISDASHFEARDIKGSEVSGSLISHLFAYLTHLSLYLVRERDLGRVKGGVSNNKSMPDRLFDSLTALPLIPEASLFFSPFLICRKRESINFQLLFIPC